MFTARSAGCAYRREGAILRYRRRVAPAVCPQAAQLRQNRSKGLPQFAEQSQYSGEVKRRRAVVMLVMTSLTFAIGYRRYSGRQRLLSSQQ